MNHRIMLPNYVLLNIDKRSDAKLAFKKYLFFHQKDKIAEYPHIKTLLHRICYHFFDHIYIKCISKEN